MVEDFTGSSLIRAFELIGGFAWLIAVVAVGVALFRRADARSSVAVCCCSWSRRYRSPGTCRHSDRFGLALFMIAMLLVLRGRSSAPASAPARQSGPAYTRRPPLPPRIGAVGSRTLFPPGRCAAGGKMLPAIRLLCARDCGAHGAKHGSSSSASALDESERHRRRCPVWFAGSGRRSCTRKLRCCERARRPAQRLSSVPVKNMASRAAPSVESARCACGLKITKLLRHSDECRVSPRGAGPACCRRTNCSTIRSAALSATCRR